MQVLFFFLSFLTIPGLSINPQLLQNCSSISLSSGDTVVFGRNHDGNISNTLIVYNPAGIYKEGFEYPGEAVPKWKSKYASITFGGLGAGFAILGMNEAGLAIGHMGFSEAKYPPKDDRPVIDQIQFIAYLLDNCENTEEVITGAEKIRIDDESITREHYFVCDKKGEKAILEFIEGKLVVYTTANMPYPLISNDSYEKSLKYLEAYSGFGGEKPVPEKVFGVEEIMAIGCRGIQKFNSEKGSGVIESAFSILHDIGFNKYPPPDSIEVPENYGTQFTVVFDLKNLKVYFKTKSDFSVREIDFAYFNNDCKEGLKVLEIEETTGGKVNSRFRAYTKSGNHSFVRRMLNGSGLPEEVITFLADYPETFKCD
ncbi:MAG: linear amide C-N hydrolase [Ignavibacteriaceae bacterium]|nr:linear amide C-N hydrolase [Ignavibacteriaceae bacterium]